MLKVSAQLLSLLHFTAPVRLHFQTPYLLLNLRLGKDEWALPGNLHSRKFILVNPAIRLSFTSFPSFYLLSHYFVLSSFGRLNGPYLAQLYKVTASALDVRSPVVFCISVVPTGQLGSEAFNIFCSFTN
jgi:hypothetical protein